MQCVKPFRIKNPDRFVYKKPNQNVGPMWLEVPCGHCIACRIARSREWAVRILHETEFWDSSCFVTLTYRDEDLPPNGSLDSKALTNFFKRLRKDLGERKIKYYACGEYGDTYGRPHYHAIIFGLNALKDKMIIESNWPYGWVKVGGVSYNSARYVAGYVQKKLYGKESKQYEDRGILPPFSRISKGIGERYVEKYWNKLYQQETVTVRGVPMGLPRYYMKKLDYDGFLRYDMFKESDFYLQVMERNKGFVSDLDEKVLSGEITPSEARAELDVLFDYVKMDSNLQKEKTLAAKSKLKKRGSL